MIISQFKDPAGMARDVWQEILADPDVGFNQALAQTAVWCDVDPFVINFTNDPAIKKINFVLAEIDPDTAVEDGPFSFPLLSLFAGKRRNTNNMKGYLFSGTVYVIADLHIPFVKARTNQDFEHKMDAASSAMLVTLNNESIQSRIQAPLSYNGDLETIPLPVRDDGQHWLRTMRFIFPVEADIPQPYLG